MELMNIKVAVAATYNFSVQEKQFGDAYKYVFYLIKDSGIEKTDEVVNPYADDQYDPGLVDKGDGFVGFLRRRNVRVIVSQQFGAYLKKLNKFFIPVQVATNNIDQTLAALLEKKNQLIEELNTSNPPFNLFKL